MTTPQPRRHFTLDDQQEAADAETSLRHREAFAGTSEHQPLAPLPEDKALPAASLGAPRKRRWGLLFALIGVPDWVPLSWSPVFQMRCRSHSGSTWLGSCSGSA